MRLVVVSGMSGAGKTLTLRIFEDLGFLCVDNLPPALLPDLADLFPADKPRAQGVVVVIDVRSLELFNDVYESLDEVAEQGVRPQILFLDASDEALVQRFKETRRKHPLSVGEMGILESIREERKLLQHIRGRADKVINTTHLDPQKLKEEIVSFFADNGSPQMTVSVLSFGFKRGVPLDADLVFDVRFMSNPHYIIELRPFTGNDPAVRDYVFSSPVAVEYFQRLCDFLAFCLPHYVSEGKAYLTIAIGCTGGKHRSVVIANALCAFLKERGYRATADHRDIDIE
ncbi:MAG: RNase adapter RapZ [Armatimonadetes bacterium]|nr:RNase adapter RapZ [Armatimonadota bacterium]